MMSNHFTVSLESLPNFCTQLIETYPNVKIWLFEGHLGAGKTTTIKALCQSLGVREATSSPSYSLVNLYKAANNVQIYHADLYRLETIEEAWDMGLHEIWASPNADNYLFMEWFQLVYDYLPLPILKLTFSSTADQNDERVISVEYLTAK
jgi:tRNA threonylcarbamoyladenosine biosynthesis protein TsaE